MMTKDVILAQCYGCGELLKASHSHRQPMAIGELLHFFLTCPGCGALARIRTTRRAYDALSKVKTPSAQEVGDQVAYFRRILDDVNSVDEIVEWRHV